MFKVHYHFKFSALKVIKNSRRQFSSQRNGHPLAKEIVAPKSASRLPSNGRCVFPNRYVVQTDEVHRPDVAFFNHLQQGVQVHPHFEGGLALAAYLI